MEGSRLFCQATPIQVGKEAGLDAIFHSKPVSRGKIHDNSIQEDDVFSHRG